MAPMQPKRERKTIQLLHLDKIKAPLADVVIDHHRRREKDIDAMAPHLFEQNLLVTGKIADKTALIRHPARIQIATYQSDPMPGKILGAGNGKRLLTAHRHHITGDHEGVGIQGYFRLIGPPLGMDTRFDITGNPEIVDDPGHRIVARQKTVSGQLAYSLEHLTIDARSRIILGKEQRRHAMAVIAHHERIARGGQRQAQPEAQQ